MAHAQIHQLPAVARIQQTLQAALASFQQGRHGETADLCNQILQTNPREASALHLLGVSQLSLSRPTDAVATLERATDADPKTLRLSPIWAPPSAATAGWMPPSQRCSGR